jgi:hypothetical protein
MSPEHEPGAEVDAGDAAPGTVPDFDLQAWLQSRPPRDPTPGVDDQTYPAAADLLAKVVDHYLTSREFNGLPVGQSTGPMSNAEQLIRDGLVQLVTSTDYLNTHIRPWLKTTGSARSTSLPGSPAANCRPACTRRRRRCRLTLPR